MSASRQEPEHTSGEPAPLAWGIVGPGAIARVFAAHAAAAGVGRVARVAGRSIERTAAFCGDLGGEPAKTLDELLADPAVEAVYVATPHPFHDEAVRACLAAGRPVLCEKPMTIDLRRTEELVRASRAHGVLLIEAWMYRCHPQIERLLAILASGELGRPLKMTSWFAFEAPFDPRSRLYAPELGGGAILDIGGYPVSLALAVARVAERSASLPSPVSVAARGRRAPTGVDAHAEATLRFSSGFSADVMASIGEERGRGAEIECERGRLVVDDPFLPEGRRDGRIGRLRIEGGGVETRDEAIEAPLDCYALEAREVARLLAAMDAPIEASPPLPDHGESLAIAAVLADWRVALERTAC